MSIPDYTDYAEGAEFDDDAVRRELIAENARLRAALEPFAGLAQVKGGTPGASALKAVIVKILENLPYPQDIAAVNEFCTACLNARAALGTDEQRRD